MKILFILVGILMMGVGYGQTLKFRDLLVDTIKIEGHSGYYHFDSLGTSTGRTDSYTISYNSKAGKYFVTSFEKVLLKSTSNPSYSSDETKIRLKRNVGRMVSNDLIEGLLTSIPSHYYPKPTFKSFGLDTAKILASTDKKNIRRIGKRFVRRWFFNYLFLEEEEKNLLFSGCQNIDTFNLFLEKRYEYLGFSLGTDFSDNVAIYLKTKEKTFMFKSDCPGAFGQPWHDYSESPKIFPIPVFNLDINRYLLKILPKKFYRRNTIEIQSATDTYILWYLGRRDFVSQFWP